MKYLNAVKKLEFEEKPHYGDYRKMFRDLFNRNGYTMDWNYDWVKSGSDSSNTQKETPQLNKPRK